MTTTIKVAEGGDAFSVAFCSSGCTSRAWIMNGAKERHCDLPAVLHSPR